MSEGGERLSSGHALLTPAQMVNHMTSRRRVHGFHACVHVCVQEVSEWPRTMDNKTFNSLFHRLPCQRSGAANNQNYSVSERVQRSACACWRRVAIKLRGFLFKQGHHFLLTANVGHIIYNIYIIYIGVYSL